MQECPYCGASMDGVAFPIHLRGSAECRHRGLSQLTGDMEVTKR